MFPSILGNLRFLSPGQAAIDMFRPVGRCPQQDDYRVIMILTVAANLVICQIGLESNNLTTAYGSQ